MLKYFDGKLSQGFTALFAGRMIQFIANGFIGIFLPIFLLIKLDYHISSVLWFMLLAHFGYGILLPVGARFISYFGMKRSLQVSIIFEAAFYFCLYLTEFNTEIFLPLALIMWIFNRLAFWLPYNVDFAKFTDRSNRGKEVSLMWATKSLVEIVMPIVAGVMIGFFGFDLAIFISIFLLLSASVPFLALPHTGESFEWGYIETFRHFFKKKNRALLIANFANGAENEIGIVIWPIFIWYILNGNYYAVGAVSSLIVFCTIIMQLAAGKLTDNHNKRKMMHWGSIFYAFGWVIKVFVLTSFQIFVVGAYHSFVKIFKDTPFDTLNFEILADHGHYVDEYTVLKDMAVQFGKVFILVFCILILNYFGLNWTFMLAALASLLVNLL